MKKRALISVSDKNGVERIAMSLHMKGVEIISTGGTAKLLKDSGIPVIGISDITNFPECLDGRVKTLHPAVHGGLLALRDNKAHMDHINELGIAPIDYVIVNLYPFKKTIRKEGVTIEEAIENIDIGGPSMLRSAAKNYKHVIVIVDPSDYDRLIQSLDENDDIPYEFRAYLAAKVFEHTAHYDALICEYLRNYHEIAGFPSLLTLAFEKAEDLRYGENPHQIAALYKDSLNVDGALTKYRQLHGKQMSFNNINDANTAIELLREFDEPTAVAIKHANPCGVGSGTSICEAFRKAYEADKVSIFGGIVALNRQMDFETADMLTEIFIEVVIAPSFTDDALKLLTQKKNIRLLELPGVETKLKSNTDVKRIAGGLLIQTSDDKLLDDEKLEVVTYRNPTEEENNDLLFAWKVVKHVKSNAIVIAKNKQTLGIGTGQMNRIWAVENALKSAKDKTIGAVMSSDAFFPFDDCVKTAALAGISAIIQPGGSIKDKDSVDACDRSGIAMIFTGIRHFKH